MNEAYIESVIKSQPHDRLRIVDTTSVYYGDVLAIDTVRFGQDYNKVTQSDVVDTISRFISRSYTLTEETETSYVYDVDAAVGETITITRTVLTIIITSRSITDVCNGYGFSDTDMEIAENIAYNLGLTNNESESIDLDLIYYNLPYGEIGADIVRQSLKRIGDTYLYGANGSSPGTKTDCSNFTLWSYMEEGIALPRTAAEQAKYCADNSLTISRDDLMPGDLLFFSYAKNDRFMSISHVAIYVGHIDGEDMIVHASSSAGKVVYAKLKGEPKLCGRAYL
jgi:hypothetical protein